MLSVTVDDLLLSYKNQAIQQNIYNHLSSAFDITTPSDISKLKFLSLTIYQSSHGTRIDQSHHIQNKILAHWFDQGHLSKKIHFPFPTDSSFELDLSQASPLTGSDLETYEAQYHGAFNHTVRKLLHIQQWTHPDINFAVTLLASFTRAPNKPAFLALEHLMRYLHTHIHEPIFYPHTSTSSSQQIQYMFSLKQSLQYQLPSSPVFFSNSSFGNILPHRCSIQSHCGLFNGVITSWTTNIQTIIAADSTDAELCSLYCTIKRIVSFSHFLISSGILNSTPCHIVLYADNAASINIILQNKISSRSCHLDIPVTFSYKKLQQKYFTLEHINTKLNAADISTKATTGPILARHWNFLRGLRFHPSTSTSHGVYLTTTQNAITTI